MNTQDEQQNRVLVKEEDEKRKRLQNLLAKCKSEAEFRQQCEKEFPDMSSLFVSWATSIRVANLYFKGYTEPIFACVS